tara:strand:- start:13818 stop:18155 length:4338 start_codon:yes stop_codon:yes gene_type:complete
MAEILLVNKYKDQSFNIPFYETQTGFYKVKIKVDKLDFNQPDARNQEFIEAGTREFITSYLPEFYSYLFDEQYFQDNCDPNPNDPNCDVNILEVASELKEEIEELVSVESTFPTSPPGPKTIVILNLRYDFDSKREDLENSFSMPLYQPNLDFFNEAEGITGPIDQTTLTVGTIGTENKLLNNGLKTFDTQYKGFEGQIDLNVDFGYMSIAATKILNILVVELTKQLRIQSPSYDFSEADTLTLFFGKKKGKLAVSGINYLLIEKSIQSEPLKIGYFSIAKYDKTLQDPLTLAVLRNYRQILTSIQGANDSGTSYSFFDFLNNDSVKDSLNSPGTVFDNFNPQPKKDLDNELLKVANEYGLIDVNNVDALEKSFKTAFYTEELRKLKEEVANNPKVYKRVLAAQKAKALNTGVDVTKAIGSVLEQGPLGFMDKNPQVKYLFRQLGIDELAKEAFLCLTFGMSMELGRINKAVQNSLVRASSSIYYPPDKPKSSPINKPKIDLEMFKPFTVSGDIWKEIEKAIIDALQQTVLEVIKKVAELLRENCDLNTPRSSDYGANNLADFIADNPNPENDLLPLVGAGSQLDQISNKNGMSNAQVLQYLSDLSAVLSSIDICILLLNREDASDELLSRILEFNSEYQLDIVRDNLNSISEVLGFFADLSAVVDATDLCNQIANELYDINQDNVCLTEGDLQDANIQELLDLIENGLTVNAPSFDLDCPDSEFLDPTISKSIPETFNALAESIQIQFISSADSAKQILLEPVLENQSGVLENFKNAGITGSAVGPSIDLAFLEPITDALSTIGDTIDLDDCPVDLPSVLGFDPAALGDAGTEALGILTDTLKDPELINGLTGIANKIQQLSSSAASTNPVFTTYQFNQEFINKFRDYIDPDEFAFYRFESNTPKYYKSWLGERPIPASGLSVTGIAQDFDPTQGDALDPNSTGEHQHMHEGGGDRTIHENHGDFYEPHAHPESPLLLESEPVGGEVPTAVANYEGLTLNFIFSEYYSSFTEAQQTSEVDELRIIFPRFTEESRGRQEEIEFKLDRLVSPENTSLITSGSKAAPLELEPSSDGENLFISLFADPFIEALGPDAAVQDTLNVFYETFPKAYGSLVDSMFNYILRNGVFDAATLQSMNLFSLNENCPPRELADFLDIDGIINQMLEEYREAACGGDDSPLSSKIRNVIKYGMYQLLVQISIAEVIIKNIFVMSAFDLSSLLDKDNFVFQFIRGQILKTLLTYFDNIQVADENIIRQDLAKYFNLKIKRGLVLQNGGISYSDGSIAFPSGTQFSVTDEDTFVGFDEILDFLISDRIQRSRNSINNALKKALPNKKQVSFEKAALSTIPVLLLDPGESTPAPGDDTYQGFIEGLKGVTEAFGNPEGFYIIKDELDGLVQGTRASLWFYDGTSFTRIIKPFFVGGNPSIKNSSEDTDTFSTSNTQFEAI